MQKSREWLNRHGTKLAVALSFFLVVSALVGQLRGRSAVLITSPDHPAQVAQSPVWLLYLGAMLPLLLVFLSKSNTLTPYKKPGRDAAKRNRAGKR